MGPIKKKVHINVDLGEGYGNFKCGPDDELVRKMAKIPSLDWITDDRFSISQIPMIDHANVACGFHAGDPLIM